ncbi:putative patatin-like phospholipase [Fusarium austroafricanum]|uniref:Putative patatin-like phospholipase n=1 Tax=Fusarium austroafricanum TaxID=2364996 RepID=A0A8H4KLE6_9HYPO|nr:putative patatin-like phospholipase [Fusarium austroafricanum]
MRYNKTLWLSLYSRGNNADLLVSDRMQSILDCVPNPDFQRPSLLVLIGNVSKTIALRELFGLKRTGRFNLRRSPTEVHLHVDPMSVFGDNPLFIVDGDLCDKPAAKPSATKGLDMTRRSITRPNEEFGSSGPIGSIYGQLLAPFANVFCFFCEDLEGVKRVSRHLAAWLEHDYPSTLPAGTRPRVVVVTEKSPAGAETPIMASSFFLDNCPPGSHYFAPENVFSLLYEGNLKNACKHRVMAFEESNKVILRSGFVDMVRKHFEHYVHQATHGSKLPADIHIENLGRHKCHWLKVYSNSVCLACLRRRPIYDLPCGHVICGNCVRVFGETSKKEPYVFHVRRCFLCQAVMPKDLCVRMHPPTAGVGILCIDGGGIRGIMPLQIIKRIRDRIDLPIPFQRFIKVAFGISSGGLIVADLFMNGSSIEESSEKFEALAKCIFQRRAITNVPFLPKILKDMMPLVANGLHPLPSLLYLADMIISYFNDGLYPSSNIESALKRVFGANRSILDISSAVATGTLIGLPVATASDKPTCRIFTNYNCEGEQSNYNDYTIKPRDGTVKLRLWEIAQAISAAQGVFPAKHIHGVGTFQDAGPLENDPLISALTTAAMAFPLLEEPDFIVSLGTGEPKPHDELPIANSRNTWKNGALPRLCRLVLEKMRDKKVRQAFQGHPRYHRLNVQFDGDEPRLDDVHSIPELKCKAEQDQSISREIDNVARCFVASLFYFELDSLPRQIGGRYRGTGHILCSIRQNDPAFPVLFSRLSQSSARFWIDGWPEVGNADDNFDSDGNFRKRVELNTNGRFTVTLQENTSEQCNVSGSPFSVERLIRLQGFKAVFGQQDHKKRKSPRPLANSRRKQRRIV